MNRRQILLTGLAAAAPLPARADVRTRWTVRDSEGLDAIAFLGPLSGKPFYTAYYAAELAAFAPRWPDAAKAALARVQKAFDDRGDLLWPTLASVLSGAPDATLAEMIGNV